MNTQKSVIITFSGKDGIFKVEKDLTLFRQHETKDSIAEIIPQIVKEVKKLLKTGNEVSFDILSMDEYYHRYSEMRYLLYSGWNHPTMDERRITSKNDFSESNPVTYEKESFMFKQFTKSITQKINYILGSDLPQNRSFYGQEQDEKWDREEQVN